MGAKMRPFMFIIENFVSVKATKFQVETNDDPVIRYYTITLLFRCLFPSQHSHPPKPPNTKSAHICRSNAPKLKRDRKARRKQIEEVYQMEDCDVGREINWPGPERSDRAQTKE